MPSRVDEGDTLERQLRLACAELERRLYAGEDCRAETIIERIPALASDPNCTIELIYAEYVIREELGQNPSPEEFFVRFPQWRERLERQFQVHELLSGEEDLEPNRLLDLPMIPKPGDGAENYEVLEKIGQGAMGEVFKVLDRQLNRVVALKKIRPSASPSEMVRFRQEAEKMAQLEHPNIVRVYAVGELNGLPFFSMELAPGGNLSQLIGDKSQSPDLTAQYGETLARAMHYAHLQNIIHRDLKPSNVVLTAAGEPKITDFGLAKTVKEWTDESRAEGEASRQGEGEKSGGAVQNTVVTETMRDTDSEICLPGSPSVPRNPPLTQTGTVLGTPAYMSPEQAAGNSAEIGPRTDVYALGTILYEMLTGLRPFQGRSPREILKQVQEEEPKPPRALNRKLDVELEAVCLKCLEKKPHRRYPSADALAEDLRRWQRGDRTLARPRGRLARAGMFIRRHTSRIMVAAAIGLAALVTLVVNHVQDPDRPLRLIQRELDSGRSVTLIGETGYPKWYRWKATDPQGKVSIADDGAFSVSASKFGLLELVPGIKSERYRISGEVRHDWGDNWGSQVGLYFAHNFQDAGQGKKPHVFYTLSFTDLISPRKMISENHPDAQMNWILSFRCNLEPEDKPLVGSYRSWFNSYIFSYGPFPDLKGDQRGVWRPLEVVVTPDLIQEKGEKSDLVTKKIFETWKKGYHKRLQDWPNTNPDFVLRGSLGLYVTFGSASFRNIMIEPLR